MVQVQRKCLLLQVFTIDSSIAINIACSDTYTIAVIFTKTTAYVDSFLHRRTAAISNLQISIAVRSSSLRLNVNSTCCSFRQRSSVQAQAGTGNNADAVSPEIRNIFLAQQTGNTIYIVAVARLVNTTNRNISVCAATISSYGRIKRQCITNATIRSCKFFNSFIADFADSHRSRHNILLTNHTNSYSFFCQTAGQFILAALNNNLSQIAMHGFCACRYYKAYACNGTQH